MNAFRPPQDNFFWAREEIDPHNFTEILLARGEASGLEGESKNRNICIQYCISLRNGKHPPPPLPRHKLRHLSPPALSALRSRRPWMRWRCLWRPRQRSTRASVTVIPTWTGNKSPSPSPPPSTGGGREPARYP